tara:strand:- start:573 stop:1223 length:651 start_codon:yes stop_codon:yes gene_type:complete
MSDIFDEVSEELKQDRLLQIWKKFSKYIISFLILIIVSIFSYKIYLNWIEKKLEASSEQFFSAIEKLENKKYKESSKIFLKSSKENNDGYRVLSLFGLAEISYKKGNIREMTSYYKYIYEDDNIDLYYRNLSRLLTVMKDNISSFEHQLNILKPILNSPSKLQLLAAELEVILHIRSNNIKEAITKLKNLLERSDVSFEQKSRLELIKKIYNSNAK